MAPELFNGDGNYTKAVDVYSYSMVLVEIATQDVPYPNVQSWNLTHNVVVEGKRPQIPNDCPPLYAELMSECWSADPEARPSFTDIVITLQTLSQLFPLQ